ncbi:MAG: cadherin-like beta sandwich domain-containing protein [Clostridia bacterium]|nr:cadherin-like beta sandwich domain-containing protein [Clostridia bacterium]
MKKNLLTIFLSFLILFSAVGTVFAKGNTLITGPTDVVSGSTVTYVVTINAREPAGSYYAKISTTGMKVLSVAGGPSNWNNMSTTNSEINSYFAGDNPKNSAQYRITCLITAKSGVATLNISNVVCGTFRDGTIGETSAAGGRITATVKAPGQKTTAPNPSYQNNYDTTVANKSSDNKLKSLSVEGYDLSPAFSPNTTSYSISNLPENINDIKINAVPNDPKAKVEIFGEKLSMGKNEAMIRVTAQNGAINTYKIAVVRGEETTTKPVSFFVGLRSLEVKPGIVSPKFSRDKKEYVVYLPYEESKITIFAEPTAPTLKISGLVQNQNINVGKNVFEIKVSDAESSKTEIYKLYVVRMPQFTGLSSLITNKTVSDKKFIIYLSVVGILSLITGILLTLLIVNLKKMKKPKNIDNELDLDKFIEEENPEDIKNENQLSGDDFYDKYK